MYLLGVLFSANFPPQEASVSESEMHLLIELRLFCFQNATPLFFPFFLVTPSGYTSSVYHREKKVKKSKKIQPWCIISPNGLGVGFIYIY